MFKELKILKLSLFAIFLGVIIWGVQDSHKFSLLITSQPSFGVNDEIKVFQAGNYSSNNELVEIKSMAGEVVFEKEVVFENNLDRSLRTASLPTSNVFELPKEIKSGFYTVGGDFPLIVRNGKKYDVTIVFPFLNNMIYEKDAEKSVLTEKMASFNIFKSVKVGDFTKGLKVFFEYCENNYDVNYIADLDLEDASLFKSSKVMVLYGRTAFYTSLMRQNLEEFIEEGGSVVLISSSLSNNSIWLEKEMFRFKQVKEDKDFGITSWLALNKDIRESIGLSDKYGGTPRTLLEEEYQVLNNSHPLFEGVSESTIPIEGEYYNGVYCKWEGKDSIPVIANNKLFSAEILAYNICVGDYGQKNAGGIYIVQPDSTSGKIVSLGTEDWCLPKNQNKKEIEVITKNAIKYLMK